ASGHLRERRLADCADHRLAAIEQARLGGGGGRRGVRFNGAFDRVAALHRDQRQTVALQRPLHHWGGRTHRRGGCRGRDFEADKKARDGENRATATGEISRMTAHGRLPRSLYQLVAAARGEVHAPSNDFGGSGGGYRPW